MCPDYCVVAVLLALIFGGCLGLLTAALCTVAGRSDRFREPPHEDVR